MLAVALMFTLGTMLTGVGPDQPRRELPGQFAHSIVPIVIGYVIAHYLTYLLEVGEQTIVYMSDPFSNGSNWFGTAELDGLLLLLLPPDRAGHHQGARGRGRATSSA